MTGIHRLTAAVLVATALLVAAPSPGGASAATACAKTYTAVRNDSWVRIADKVGVSVASLLKANKATRDTMILIGENLCLPKAAKTPGKAKTAEKSVTPKVPRVRYTPSQVAAIIKEVFPAKLRARAIQIAKRESKLNPYATSWCCLGLFQIYWEVHRPSLRQIGITSAQQLFDPLLNARAALLVYKRSGSWEPWALR